MLLIRCRSIRAHAYLCSLCCACCRHGQHLDLVQVQVGDAHLRSVGEELKVVINYINDLLISINYCAAHAVTNTHSVDIVRILSCQK